MAKKPGERPTVSREPKKTADEAIAEALAEFYADPLGHVMFSYPWDTDKSIQLVALAEPYASRFGCKYGPDVWACQFLDQLGAEVRKRGFDGEHSVLPIQFSTTSGHGIGKSVLVAWIIKWIMDTRPYAKGVVTAMTDAQLRTKTWAEVGKWHKLSLTSHWFDYNTGRGAMALLHKEHPGTWRCDAQTCREENSEAFAGLHAANSTPFYIFDEASGVPDKIFEVREGGTTDGEPMTFDFGNPTRNAGKFFENCQGRFRHRYIVKTIDSRDVAITNKERIEQWVSDYGIESDFVKVRVRGLFPSAGSTQFIPTGDVEEAMLRTPIVDRSAQLVIGVDVARFGDDDSVIWARVGNDARSWPPECYNGADSMRVAGLVIAKIRMFRELGLSCAGLFIDGTGGYGGGVIDRLRELGYSPIEVNFGGTKNVIEKETYQYKVDEMWGRMREAIKTRLVLPGITDPKGVEIKEQLTQREFGYTLSGSKIRLETKEDMKARSVGSPDIADALALTYAFDVAPAAPPPPEDRPKSTHDYDPLRPSF